MQLSPRLSAFVAVMLAQAAQVPTVLANEADLLTPSRFQEHLPFTTASSIPTPICEMNDPVVFDLRGSNSSDRLYDLPPEVIFDARRVTWESDIRRNSAAVRLYGAKSLCWVGGSIIAHETRQNVDSSGYLGTIGLLVSVIQPYSTVTVNDLAISRLTNGIYIRGILDSIFLSALEVHDIHDACVIADAFRVVVVRHSFFDGCGKLVSLKNQRHEAAGELVLEGNVIRLNVSDIGPRSVDRRVVDLLFSETSTTPIKLYDNVILFEGIPERIIEYVSTKLLPKVVDCANNVLIIQGADQYHLSHPNCGLITNNRDFWERAKNAWMSRDAGDGLDPNLDGAPPNVMPNSLSGNRTGEVRSRVDGSLMSEAGGAPDVVAKSRRSIERAIRHAERATTTVASFTKRWADGTFWHDGTGWRE